MDRFTFKATWLIMGLILALCLCSCSRKVIRSMERTSDTLIIHHSDTLQVYDTIKVISKMETTNSVTDNMVTYVVVDTTGRVLTKYVYRDRNVYHNKDALSTSSHTTNKVNTNAVNTTLSKNIVVDNRKKRKKEKAIIIGILLFLSFVALPSIFYRKK